MWFLTLTYFDLFIDLLFYLASNYIFLKTKFICFCATIYLVMY